MKLYTFPGAPNGRKVNAVIQHLEIKGIETEVVNLAEGAQRKPEYMAINPMGRIPTLIDGDLILWESNAICEYLCDLQGETSFFPRDRRVRADISRWLYWQAGDLAPAALALSFENFLKKMFFGGEPDPVKVKEGEAKFRAVASVLDRHLEGRRFMVGDNVTLADFAMAALFAVAGPGRFPLAEYQNIQAWNRGLHEIPAWKNTAPQPRG